jgi:DNA-binding transcriptional MerR regulator
VRYRVDGLAARCGLSVDTVRFYQSRGLLPQPQREGRVAWYGDAHLERLHRIRDLKDKGFTLASIKRLLDGEVDAADAALGAALAGESNDAPAEDLTLDELATRTGVSPALLGAIEREGLLTPRRSGGRVLYSAGDVAVVAAGLELLGAGLPLGELLDLARRHDEAMRSVATRAVELFARFVRDPIRSRSVTEEEAATNMVDAFRKMLPAASALVGHHFRRVLLEEARARLEKEGVEFDVAAEEASWSA